MVEGIILKTKHWLSGRVFIFCFLLSTNLVSQVSRSVAVFTFDNLTGDSSNNWIGVGFGETMTNKLNNVQALRMQSRRQLNDVLLTRGLDQRKISDKNADEIGKLLGVDYLLVGSVQSAADISQPEAELLVNARIIDARTAQILQIPDSCLIKNKK